MKTMITTMALSLLWTVLILVIGGASGFLNLSVGTAWLANPGTFIFRHLQMSIVPFFALFLIYFFLIARVKSLLAAESASLASLSYYDRLLNAIISSFFGVGVIWTAVGMEGALVQAMVGITGSRVAISAVGPLDLLERLVNGGLLIALSTTIFGGVCGYLLRLLKIILLGERWDLCMLREANDYGKTSAAR